MNQKEQSVDHMLCGNKWGADYLLLVRPRKRMPNQFFRMHLANKLHHFCQSWEGHRALLKHMFPSTELTSDNCASVTLISVENDCVLFQDLSQRHKTMSDVSLQLYSKTKANRPFQTNDNRVIRWP